jgi:hypothetical protein
MNSASEHGDGVHRAANCPAPYNGTAGAATEARPEDQPGRLGGAAWPPRGSHLHPRPGGPRNDRHHRPGPTALLVTAVSANQPIPASLSHWQTRHSPRRARPAASVSSSRRSASRIAPRRPGSGARRMPARTGRRSCSDPGPAGASRTGARSPSQTSGTPQVCIAAKIYRDMFSIYL